ncbi:MULTISPECIES: DNA adenine methylase [Dokdonia]|uniref:site-specific DNA-methyltransferase (adenine-specific) n=2 Tax=Dokdonia TaxID=326319 RepID=A0A0A2GYT7_9FLAO|nr:DNA adenine methylase [Dokdonia donghaensis]ANH60213.1 Modification methylase FokI [Dokdonia donghaensis DSW-1]KGO07501.1 modification methylase [Dokdonia donghaensis DSW-1]
MNYIGSKLKLSQFIKETIKKTVDYNTTDTVFCDLFAGTGTVGRLFKNDVKKVISNDIEYYAYILNKNYVENNSSIPNYTEYFDFLNNLEPITTGFIYNNYCAGGHGERLYFSDHNGQMLDAIRQQIELWHLNKEITEKTYIFLLASLIESMDKVANTASVYGAYLKKLKKSAKKDIVISPAFFEITSGKHKAYNSDSNVLIKKISGDILYLDPPYNTRQYGSNYHLLNTISKFDKFEPKGKTGLREYNRSKYCSKRTVLKEFEELIANAKFKNIFLSYNNEGLMSLDQIGDIMSKYGQYNVISTDYQRFKADNKRTNKSNKTTEYIHILEKRLASSF